MRKLFFVLFILTFSKLYCQGEVKKNNGLYIQFYGNTETLLSLNYERIFYTSKNELVDLNVRTGFGFHKAGYDSSIQYSLAVELNGIIGKDKHFADIGLGFTPNFNNSDLSSLQTPDEENGNYYYIYTVRFGYRIVFEKRIFMRVSPIITYRPVTPKSSDLFFRPSFGFSMGFIF